jgi:glucose-1-phosphate adenylyltransferase
MLGVWNSKTNSESCIESLIENQGTFIRMEIRCKWADEVWREALFSFDGNSNKELLVDIMSNKETKDFGKKLSLAVGNKRS